MGFSLLPKIPSPFVLPRHATADKPPTWLLRTLPQRWFGRLDMGKIESQAQQMDLLVWLVSAALVGVENVEQDGKPVEFVQAGKRDLNGWPMDGGAPLEFLDALPLDVLAELAAEVIRRNRLDPASMGN